MKYESKPPKKTELKTNLVVIRVAGERSIGFFIDFLRILEPHELSFCYG